MSVMEEENKELRERLAGLAVDAETAEGAEPTETAAAAAPDSVTADGKDKKVHTTTLTDAPDSRACRKHGQPGWLEMAQWHVGRQGTSNILGLIDMS